MDLTDSRGGALNGGSTLAGRSVGSTMTGLTPGGRYEVYVLGPADTRTATAPDGTPVTAYLRLTANSAGTIPETVLAYDLTSGEYTVQLFSLTRGRNGDESRSPATSASFTTAALADTDKAIVLGTAPNPTGLSSRSALVGDSLYARLQGLPANQTVDVYVVASQDAWSDGDPLVDASGAQQNTDPPAPRRGIDGGAETATADGTGIVPSIQIWGSVTGAGGVYDVVVDVDRNGRYDSATDIVNDVRTVGLTVQESANRSIVDGHFVANLSVGPDRIRQDTFRTDEDVYVYINPDTRMELGSDRWVKKYIVAHKSLANWADGDALVDVSGPNNEWDADTVQSGCTNEGRVLVWPANLTAGDYDIVIDVNRNDHYDKGVDIIDASNDDGTDVGFHVGAAPGSKTWTVMVYMAADNDLEEYAIKDINEMEQVADYTNVNVVVQIDRAPGYDSSNGDWTTTRRYLVTHDSDTATIGSTMVADLGEIDTANPEALRDFVNWGRRTYPAQHYAVIVWNHGAGFRSRENVREAVKNVAWDQTNGGSITLPGVANALRMAGRPEFVGFDACLLGMAETAAQFEDVSQVLVGSQDTEPGDGWPYDTILQSLTTTPTQTATQWGGVIVDAYRTSYGATDGTTLSCIALHQPTANVRTSVNALALALITDVDGTGPGQAPVDQYKSQIVTAFGAAQRFAPTLPFDDYRDLYDLAAKLKTAAPTTEVTTACDNVMTAVTAAVTANTQSGRPEAHGLTIWAPNRLRYNNSLREFAELDLAKDTKWDEFLAALWGVLYRVELTWGATPSDLDSHLWDASGNHLYYPQAGDETTNIPGGFLDLDDTTSYGPENTSINYLTPNGSGKYTFSVYNYSRTTSEESATVRVYRSGSATAAYTFTTSGWNSGDHVWWTVFEIDPTTGDLTPINTRGSSATRSIRSPMPSKR